MSMADISGVGYMECTLAVKAAIISLQPDRRETKMYTGVKFYDFSCGDV